MPSVFRVVAEDAVGERLRVKTVPATDAIDWRVRTTAMGTRVFSFMVCLMFNLCLIALLSLAAQQYVCYSACRVKECE